MRTLLPARCLLITGMVFTSAQQARPETVSEVVAMCDELAASPEDLSRPAGVSGVPLDKLDADAAIEACGAALELSPGNHRMEYQLARAFQYAG